MGSERGAATVRPPPSCQRQSLHWFPQVYERRSGWLAATSGSRPRPGGPGEGCRRERGAARCAQTAQSIFRVSESPRLGRALQARSTSWFSKEVCGFLFSFSLSLFPHRDKEKISQGQAPRRRRSLPGTGSFPFGLSDLVSSLVISSEREKQGREKQQTLSLLSACRWKGWSTCASLVRIGKSKGPWLRWEEQGWTAEACWISLGAAILCRASTKTGPKSLIFSYLFI